MKNEKTARRTGQILKRGANKFLVRISLGTDPATRKRRTHNHTVRGTKADAQQYLNATLRDIDLGTFVEPSTQSLNTFVKKLATQYGVSPSTIERDAKFAADVDFLGEVLGSEIKHQILAGKCSLTRQAIANLASYHRGALWNARQNDGSKETAK